MLHFTVSRDSYRLVNNKNIDLNTDRLIGLEKECRSKYPLDKIPFADICKLEKIPFDHFASWTKYPLIYLLAGQNTL